MARNTSFSLGDVFDSFLTEQVESGEYGSATEVVREALRDMMEQKKKQAWLDAALDKGLESGPSISGADAFAKLRAKHGLKARLRG